MVLTGSFARTLDEKLRVAIPKSCRDALKLPEGAALVVAPGLDGSLAIYTEESFARLVDRLASHPPTQKDVRAFSRLFCAQAVRVELDRQGRIRIPAELAQRASLQKETVLLGVLDHLELWDRQQWEQYLASKQSQYDAIAEAAFSAPGPNPETGS